jgi:hypothetical protein
MGSLFTPIAVAIIASQIAGVNDQHDDARQRDTHQKVKNASPVFTKRCDQLKSAKLPMRERSITTARLPVKRPAELIELSQSKE